MCGTTGALCGLGKHCVSGQCICDSVSCPGAACCSASNTCVTASTAQCGSNGGACTTCDLARADSCGALGCQCGAGAACTTGTCQAGSCSTTPSAWRQASGAMPAARHRHAMAPLVFDDAVLLFGGLTTSALSSPLSDTWLWNAAAGSWSSLSGAGPGARFGHAMAALGDGTVVLQGGSTNSYVVLLADTWIFDPASGWHSSIAAGPGERYEHAMAGDVTRGVAVLFGGYGGSLYKNDTWEFNGTSWANLTPASGNPSARYAACMAFDPVRNRTVLFGGWDGSMALNDTWEWDGASWAQRVPTVSPPARDFCAMAWDQRRGVITLFSGRPGLADEWIWNGTTWAQVTNALAPPVRQGAALVEDTTTGGVFLFGGISSSSGTVRGDTWWRY